VTTDFDMFVLNEAGELVGNAFNTPNTEAGRQQPYEFDPWEGEIEGEEEELQVVVARCDAACGEARAEEEFEPGVKPYEGTKGGDDGTPRLKLAIFNNGGGVSETDYTPAEVAGTGTVVGPTIFGHTAAASAVSVAAINIGTNEEPEPYSSRGPVVHLFAPVAGTTPAPSIGEQLIPKPNVTASDCGSTTFFYGFSQGGFHFCGTSAAAPHAAAVAALIRSSNPGATNAQVRAALESTARPVGSAAAGFFDSTAVGAGLVDANSAVAALALPPAVTPPGPPAPKSSPAAPVLPVASFSRRPKAVVKTRKASVRLGFGLKSSVAGSTFRCKIDNKGGFKPCTANFSTVFKVGRHVVAAEAVDPAGTVGKPATFRFRVQKVAARHHRHRHHR
jgi:hypothetical protein